MVLNWSWAQLRPQLALVALLHSYSPNEMLGQSTRGVTAFQTEISNSRLELQTLQVYQKPQNAEDTITIADYLLSRLVETGVTVHLDPWDTPTINTLLTHLCSISLEYQETSILGSLTMWRITLGSNGSGIATNSTQVMPPMAMHVSGRVLLVLSSPHLVLAS